MIKKISNIIDKIEEYFLVLSFLIMVSVIFLQVIMRYVFNNSLIWSEELGKFIFVWISWIGIVIGHKRKEHIAITIIIDKLPNKAKKFIDLLAEIILIAICAITTYYAILMMNFQKHVPYAALKFSTSWGYLSLVIGCILFSVVCFKHILNTIFELHSLPSDSSEGGDI